MEVEIELEKIGTESHKSLGQSEAYYSMLRRTYKKFHLAHPNLPKELSLSMAVKDMNEVAGPNGLLPSLMLFGAIPKIPHIPHDNPNFNERVDIRASSGLAW